MHVLIYSRRVVCARKGGDQVCPTRRRTVRRRRRWHAVAAEWSRMYAAVVDRMTPKNNTRDGRVSCLTYRHLSVYYNVYFLRINITFFFFTYRTLVVFFDVFFFKHRGVTTMVSNNCVRWTIVENNLIWVHYATRCVVHDYYLTKYYLVKAVFVFWLTFWNVFVTFYKWQ